MPYPSHILLWLLMGWAKHNKIQYHITSHDHFRLFHVIHFNFYNTSPTQCQNILQVYSQLNQINSSHNIISFSIQNQIRNTTWRIISKIASIHQTTRTNLFILFDCNCTHSLQFQILLDPSTQSTKFPQPESHAEHTDVTKLFAH